MREIKFRAWDKNKKEMFFFELYPEPTPELIDGFYYNTDTCIPMQYTGLKDKNGKKIYEGDVVSRIVYKNWKSKDVVHIGVHNLYDPQKDKVEQEQCCGVYLTHEDTNKAKKFIGWETFEIIGNIYENPELLKAGKSGNN